MIKVTLKSADSTSRTKKDIPYGFFTAQRGDNTETELYLRTYDTIALVTNPQSTWDNPNIKWHNYRSCPDITVIEG